MGSKGTSRLLRGILAVPALLVASCVSAPDRAPPEGLDPPAGWTATTAEGPAAEAWLADLQVPELDALVAEALVHNYDLQAAAARVLRARAEARIAGADRLPEAGINLLGDRRKISTFGPQQTGGVRFDNYDLSLDLRWEIDLWRKLADRTSAALANYEASADDYEAARLSLAAQVAKAYFNLTEAQRQLDIAGQNAAVFTENESVLEGRFERGLSRGLDLQLVRTEAASSRAEVAAREQGLDRAARTLELLLGRYPANDFPAGSVFPETLPEVPAGLPSDLLARRPDLRAAERRLAAAFREHSAARKELLPSISFSASGGTASSEFENLLDENFSVWNLAGNALQPVFQGGRILAGIDRSESIAEEALANYRSAALEAFGEVETALAAEIWIRDRESALSKALEAAAVAEKQAWEQYRAGTSDILLALDAQRSANAVRTRLAATRNFRLQNRIDLYLALGGSFAATVPPETNAPPNK